MKGMLEGSRNHVVKPLPSGVRGFDEVLESSARRSAMRPLISVVIPTINRARLLQEALESVSAQYGSGEEFEMEVIVVDDGSSDNTPDVVANHAKARYIRLPTNRGSAAARNAGVRAGSGEYVVFLDDDDILLPHKLKEQIAVLQMRPEVAAIYSPCIVRSEGREKVIPSRSRGPSGFVLNALVKRNLAPIHGYLLRRSAVERASYFDEQLPCYMDWDLWLRIALHGQFIFLPRPVGIYRFSPHGLLGLAEAQGKGALAHRRIMEKLRDLLKDSTSPPEIVREARAWADLMLTRYLAPEQSELAQSRFLAALQIHPDLVREPRARQEIAQIISGMAFGSSTPISFTCILNDNIKRRLPKAGVGQQIGLARLFSDVWTRVAWGLSVHPDASDRIVARAAALALLYDPSKIKRKSLLQFIARQFVGRRQADALARLLGRKHREISPLDRIGN
jgi:hypothetical protein